MTVEIHGTPNYQRFAETWAALIASREGMEVVPGSVRVELKSNNKEKEITHESIQRVQSRHDVQRLPV